MVCFLFDCETSSRAQFLATQGLGSHMLASEHIQRSAKQLAFCGIRGTFCTYSSSHSCTLVPQTIIRWSVFFLTAELRPSVADIRAVSAFAKGEVSRLCIPPTAVSCHARRFYSPFVRAERFLQTSPRAANSVNLYSSISPPPAIP